MTMQQQRWATIAQEHECTMTFTGEDPGSSAWLLIPYVHVATGTRGMSHFRVGSTAELYELLGY